MRRVLSVVVFLTGCGGLLGLSGDDDDSAPRDPQAATDAGPDGDRRSEGGGDAGAVDADAGAPADSGTTDSSGASCEAGACDHFVFVTRAVFDGNLGGIAGADAKCQAAGDAAMPGRVWRAWISTLGSNAGQRLSTTAGAYVGGAGVIAQSWTGFASSTHLAAILDETGAAPPVTDMVWTGTTSEGGATTSLCSAWQSPGSVVNGSVGNRSALDDAWSYALDQSCAVEAHLYCIEE